MSISPGCTGITAKESWQRSGFWPDIRAYSRSISPISGAAPTPLYSAISRTSWNITASPTWSCSWMNWVPMWATAPGSKPRSSHFATGHGENRAGAKPSPSSPWSKRRPGCCPGDVTSALSAWVEKEFNIPLINLFYDGINNPNDNLKPYIHYLRKTRAAKPPNHTM